MEVERYYLKDGTRVIVFPTATVRGETVAHRSAQYFELSYRERIALTLQNRKVR